MFSVRRRGVELRLMCIPCASIRSRRLRLRSDGQGGGHVAYRLVPGMELGRHTRHVEETERPQLSAALGPEHQGEYQEYNRPGDRSDDRSHGL